MTLEWRSPSVESFDSFVQQEPKANGFEGQLSPSEFCSAHNSVSLFERYQVKPSAVNFSCDNKLKVNCLQQPPQLRGTRGKMHEVHSAHCTCALRSPCVSITTRIYVFQLLCAPVILSFGSEIEFF